MTQSQCHTYLDYNATTPLCAEAREAMVSVMEGPANASSVHAYGCQARKRLEEARRVVRTVLGAEGAEVIFTASGTEANNIAIRGLDDADHIAVSATEHVSVLEPAKQQHAVLLPVDENGLLDMVALERVLRAYSPKRLLVSVMLANNETGVIQDVLTIRDIILKYKGFIHIDASQSVGKMLVDFNRLGADMMTVSAHKCGGPHGAAALIVKSGLSLSPLVLGGGQEKYKRPGTENLAAIVGFASALDSLPTQNTTLRDYVEQQLKAIAPDAVIAGEHVTRLPNTSCITMPGVDAQTQLMHFDLDGFAVSSGSACSSGKVGKSHVLAAMGWNREAAQSAIRISTGAETTKDEIEAFIASWQRLYDRMAMKKAA